MSNLDALVERDATMTKATRMERASKPRLIADPGVSLSDLMKIIRDFVVLKDCKDILSLVVPAGHRMMSWKTAVDPTWLLRMSSLVFDFLAVAPNSKIQGKKLEQALKKMLESGDLKNETKRDDKTYIDSVNQLIRISLSQFRTLKMDITKREGCYKRLTSKEKKSFNLILDRMQLPADYEPQQSDEDQEVSCVESKPSTDSLVLYDKTSLDDDAETTFAKILGEPPLPAPCTPPRGFSKEMAGFKSDDVRAAKKLSQQGVGMRFVESPQQQSSIFDVPKKKQETDSFDSKSGLGPSKPKSKPLCLDDEILNEALQHVPKEADPKAKATKVLKRPSMMKRPSAADEEGSSAVPDVVQAGGLGKESSVYIVKCQSYIEIPMPIYVTY